MACIRLPKRKNKAGAFVEWQCVELKTGNIRKDETEFNQKEEGRYLS